MELLVLLYKFYRAQRTTQANGRIYLALLSVVVQQLLEKLSSLKPLILLKLGFTKRGAPFKQIVMCKFCIESTFWKDVVKYP